MRWTAIAGALLAASAAPGADDALPLMGLAHAGIRVSDLEHARSFYTGVLGLEQAFTTKSDDGSVHAAWFKVNDHQFFELIPGLKPDELVPMTHIAMWTGDLRRTRQTLLDRGLAPSEIRPDPRDGTLTFTLRQLPGQNLGYLEFVEYAPDSLPMKDQGKS